MLIVLNSQSNGVAWPSISELLGVAGLGTGKPTVTKFPSIPPLGQNTVTHDAAESTVTVPQTSQTSPTTVHTSTCTPSRSRAKLVAKSVQNSDSVTIDDR